MSAGRHWLGDSELWGLTPRRFAEIRDELDDHVNCVSARDGAAAADEQRAALATDQTRRRLNAVHLADQVYATLNRWPTRREWHEFMWLGIWFALIVLSDWLSLESGGARASYLHAHRELGWWDGDAWLPAGMINLTTWAWLLQGIARAGFFASFIAALWRAYRTGWGVAIARILQLKLIHTVLVITATMMLGWGLWNSFAEPYGLRVAWPTWLIAPVISVAIALAGLVLWTASRKRCWQYGLGLVLCALFLYPGGPYQYEFLRVEQPLLLKTIWKSESRKAKVPETDQAAINEYAAALAKKGHMKDAVINASENLIVDDEEGPVSLPLHAAMGQLRKWNEPPSWYDWDFQMKVVDRRLEVRSPVTVPGAGLGWLAAPIPLLGILGFLGLILVMGRRGPFDFMVYLALTFFALGSTFMPFVFAQELNRIIDFSPMGVVYTPFPGFETLLVGGELRDNWLLIFGLVLSAGIPWLLTSMFLRPTTAERSTAADESVVA